jgi:hypothetical protein
MKLFKYILAGLLGASFVPGLVTSAEAAGATAPSGRSDRPANPGMRAVPSTTPAGQMRRYVIPFYTSQTVFPAGRSVTVVSVYNTAGMSCNVSVQFQYVNGQTDICALDISIPSHTSALFCSRPVGDPLAPCTTSCPSGGLTFNTGHAFVASSTSPANCKYIVVDPRIYYTTGDDATLLSSSRLTLAKPGSATIGD